MVAHKTNSLLKYVAYPVAVALLVMCIVYLRHSPASSAHTPVNTKHTSAAQDSAAESLNTLTAQLADMKKNVTSVVTHNEQLKQQNARLQAKLDGKQNRSEERRVGKECR